MTIQVAKRRIKAIQEKVEELRKELDGMYANLRPSEIETRPLRKKIEDTVTTLQKKMRQIERNI